MLLMKKLPVRKDYLRKIIVTCEFERNKVEKQ